MDRAKKVALMGKLAPNGRITCQICGRHLLMGPYGGKPDEWPQIDHDHQCCKSGCEKCIRGILCRHCNFGLGSFKDDPGFLRLAATYLESSFVKCEVS